MHKCDNPSCVNPDHLFLGTPQDNKLDAMQKGRHARGESAGSAKITFEIAQEIRRRREGENLSYKQLAEEYSVSDSLIWAIIKNRLWLPADPNSV